MSPVQVATTATKQEHPAIDDQTEGLEEEAHEPAPNRERNHRDVQHPDEKACAGHAEQSECEQEDPV